MDGLIIFVKKNPYKGLLLSFVGILLYQSLNIFWGFEILDSGFHLTAYDNFFDAADSVSYNFMYYLTNLIGGTIMQVFPNIGIVGYRIVGALFIDCSLLLLFFSLKKEVPVIHLLMGVILVVVCYIGVPYSFCNGICTCFFYTCFSLLIYRGLINRNFILLLIGGILVGINFFSRIPNVLSIGLCLIILFNRWFTDRVFLYDWKATLFFVIGIFAGVVAIIVVILTLGHMQAFIDSLNILFFKGSSSSDTHSLLNLIIAQLFTYSNALVYVASFFTVFYLNSKLKNTQLLKVLYIIFVSILIAYHVYLGNAYNPLWALCFVGCLLCIFKRRSLSLLAMFALFMLIVVPCGSNSGYNQGSLPALIAAPISSFVLLNRRNILFAIVACFAISMKTIRQGNFFDKGPLSEKRFSINVSECSLIRTTKKRSEIFNSSLPEICKLVHPKDTLLVYGDAPMLNFLTHTRPAGGMCWPGSNGFFMRPIKNTPKILVHKFCDLEKPDMVLNGLPIKSVDIYNLLEKNNYKVVWENNYFILLFPSK